MIDSLRRELREELGVEFLHRGFDEPVYIHDIESSRTGKMVRVFCHRIKHTDTDMRFLCGDKTVGIGWFDASELATIRLAPADSAEIGKLAMLLV